MAKKSGGGGKNVANKNGGKGKDRKDSVYVVTQIVGTSPRSFAEAAQNAVKTAAKTLHDLRIAEVTKLDARIENGRIVAYRARLAVSFKYHHGYDDDD